jgi:antitoxin YefM
MNAFKYKATVKNGQLVLPVLDLPEGTIVEAILLVNDKAESKEITDETEYLLSTETNRRYLMEGLAEIKQPQNYIYIDPDTL